MSSQKSRNRKLQFDVKTKQLIVARDMGCIFCLSGYHMKSSDSYAYSIYDIAHYINKSAGGLGIPQNGVLACRYHHMLLDNGSKGLRSDMLDIIRKHLKSLYSDWNEEELYYRKE